MGRFLFKWFEGKSVFWPCFWALSMAGLISAFLAAAGLALDRDQKALKAQAHRAAQMAEIASGAILAADKKNRQELIEEWRREGIVFDWAGAGEESDGDQPGFWERRELDVAKSELSGKYKVSSARSGVEGLWVGIPLGEDVLWVLAPRQASVSAKDFWVAALTWLTAGVFVSGLMAWFFSSVLSASLNKLEKAADAAEKGLEVKVRGPLEIENLSNALARISQRLKEQSRARELALAGVSHDIRSPLARIRMASEFISDLEAKGTIQKGVSQIDGMIDAFIEYAKSEEPKQEMFCFREALREALEPFWRKEISEGRLEGFIGEKGGNLWVVGDRELLVRGFGNLAKNAFKHGVGPVWARLEEGPGWAQARIEDSGAGVPEEVKKLIAPFARGDKARGGGGAGLGLAIAARAAGAVGGELVFERSEGRFACVVKAKRLD